MKTKFRFTLAAVALSLLAAYPAHAQRKQKPISVDYLNDTFPHVVAGGSWDTTMTLVNLGDEQQEFPIDFHKSDGTAWSICLLNRGCNAKVTVRLAPFASVTLNTVNTGNLEQGWAIADIGFKDIAGSAIFRQRLPGKPDNEAVVPLSSSYEHQSVLLFDNTQGYVTGIALANPREFGGNTLTFNFRDENGISFHLGQLTLAQMNQTAFLLTDRFPQTRGRKGTVEIQDSRAYVSSLGLRFSPGGAFTSFHSFEPN